MPRFHNTLRRASLVIPALLLLPACSSTSDTPRADSAAVSLDLNAAPTKAAEIAGLSTPESALYDAARDVWYIANIAGSPNAADNNGFISKVSGDLATVDTFFIAGGSAGTTLNAPKGMAVTGDTLWVTDITAIRAFNVITGFEVATINVDGAVFLNDLTAASDGSLYFSDTGISFSADGMSHPGPDRVFKLTGRTVTEAIRFDNAPAPNGLHIGSDGRLIIAPYNNTTLLAWTPGAATADSIASGPGAFDGVAQLADGRILVSSWTDSTIHVLSGGTLTPFISGVPAPADIGVDTTRGHIAVPLFELNRVEFWKVPGN